MSRTFFFFFASPLAGQLKYITIFQYRLSTIFYKFFNFFLELIYRYYIWYFALIPPTIRS